MKHVFLTKFFRVKYFLFILTYQFLNFVCSNSMFLLFITTYTYSD